LGLLEQILANTAPGPFYEDDNPTLAPFTSQFVRTIAFYLPQFHPTPENDEWWGAGFTEWTNATKAVPRFAGHYQPRLPGAMGFYDATNPGVLRRQAQMAKRYGISGFCFHHYWFGGRRVLERPLDVLLENPDIDIPFCVNWANESWTRRWDGKERTVLLAQEHTEQDDLAFVRSLEPLFADKRYIKINGRPLLLVYRPSIFPSPNRTVARWKEYFSSGGLPEPYIAMVQRQGDGNGAIYDMDGTVGFPPFYLSANLQVRKDLELFDPNYLCKVRDYSDLAEATIGNYEVDRHCFPGVCPAWDNEARMPGQGICFTGSKPEVYGRWFRAACQTAMQNFAGDERLVFVNAWNEWAEGAYLEPDRHFGFAYLAETRRILESLYEGCQTDVVTSAGFKRSPKRGLKGNVKRVGRLTINGVADFLEEAAWTLRRL
jgi:lipopolysaccharide biosynthesis protein